MKKRSKKLLAFQLGRFWVRDKTKEDTVPSFNVFNPLLVRWREGKARNKKATILRGLITQEFSEVLRQSFIQDQEKSGYSADKNTEAIWKKGKKRTNNLFRDDLWLYQLTSKKVLRQNRRSFRSKLKNSCTFQGRGRAYSRAFRAARFAARKMLLNGNLSGVTSA